MTALAVLWMFTEVACGARSPLQSGEEELVGAGGSNSRPVGDTPHSATGGTLATGGVQYLAGSSGWDDAPRDGGRGVLGSGGTYGARPLACGPGSDSPCKNGGECVPSAGNTHQCLCRPGTSESTVSSTSFRRPPTVSSAPTDTFGTVLKTSSASRPRSARSSESQRTINQAQSRKNPPTSRPPCKPSMSRSMTFACR
jgi:hypothetical protein